MGTIEKNVAIRLPPRGVLLTAMGDGAGLRGAGATRDTTMRSTGSTGMTRGNTKGRVAALAAVAGCKRAEKKIQKITRRVSFLSGPVPFSKVT